MERVLPAAVFFDVGKTLVFAHPSVSRVVDEILRAAGHDRDLAAIESLMPLIDEYYEDRFREDDTFWTSEEQASAVWVGMYSLLARRLGIEEEAESLARAVYDEFGKPERWRAYDDVVPAFERLHDSGVKVGIISNWDSRLAKVLEGLRLTPLIDTIVCSADVGLHKPDPRIFELACARLGLSPSVCVHVGDHFYSDVLGAKAVGMRPVLIDRGLGGQEGTTRVGSVPVIRTFDELEGAL
jgi:putative hydrolase of the HAD superfamily